MERVQELVAQIAPKAAFPGQWQFTLAIFYYREVSSLNEDVPTLVTKEVYPLVSQKTGHKLNAAEKAIYRAVEYCWSDGQNERLNQVIGRALPVKPSPGEILLYCAYYLEKGKPYFS